MGDISRITITGNLTRPPEQKAVSNGRSVVEFTVANGRWRRKEGEERPTFYRVSVWNEREQAWLMAKATQGTAVTVAGTTTPRLETTARGPSTTSATPRSSSAPGRRGDTRRHRATPDDKR